MGQYVRVEFLDERIRKELRSKLLVIVSEDSVIEFELVHTAALSLAQASEDLRLGPFALRLPVGRVKEKNEAVDFFRREFDSLEAWVLAKGCNLGQPAGVFPVMDPSGEPESIEENEDRFSVSSQLNLKALINFYLPL